MRTVGAIAAERRAAPSSLLPWTSHSQPPCAVSRSSCSRNVTATAGVDVVEAGQVHQHPQVPGGGSGVEDPAQRGGGALVRDAGDRDQEHAAARRRSSSAGATGTSSLPRRVWPRRIGPESQGPRPRRQSGPRAAARRDKAASSGRPATARAQRLVCSRSWSGATRRPRAAGRRPQPTRRRGRRPRGRIRGPGTRGRRPAGPGRAPGGGGPSVRPARRASTADSSVTAAINVPVAPIRSSSAGRAPASRARSALCGAHAARPVRRPWPRRADRG